MRLSLVFLASLATAMIFMSTAVIAQAGGSTAARDSAAGGVLMDRCFSAGMTEQNGHDVIPQAGGGGHQQGGGRSYCDGARPADDADLVPDMNITAEPYAEITLDEYNIRAEANTSGIVTVNSTGTVTVGSNVGPGGPIPWYNVVLEAEDEMGGSVIIDPSTFIISAPGGSEDFTWTLTIGAPQEPGANFTDNVTFTGRVTPVPGTVSYVIPEEVAAVDVIRTDLPVTEGTIKNTDDDDSFTGVGGERVALSLAVLAVILGVGTAVYIVRRSRQDFKGF